MSFDLMVFDPAAAPMPRSAFLDWYEQQTQWSEPHGYNNPDVPAPALRTWFLDMIKTFSPMNGPLKYQDPDDPRVADYSLGEKVIYAAFAWSQAEHAHRHVFELAEKHRVGFFDLSSNDDIWLPDPEGKLVKVPL